MTETNDCYTYKNPIETIKIIIREMTEFKKANLDSDSDILKAFFQKIDYRTDESFAASLCKTFKRLEEAKLDKDPEIRKWILQGGYSISEATANYVITAVQALKEAGLDNNPNIRSIFLRCLGLGNHNFNMADIISDFKALKHEGLG